jgi:H+-transporting ATPase
MSLSNSSDHSKEKAPVLPQNNKESDNMNAIIEDLQPNHDGSDGFFEDEAAAGHSSRIFSSELSQRDSTLGLTNKEVYSSRKKYGWNKMSEEEESLIINFLLFFCCHSVCNSYTCSWSRRLG